MRSKRARRLCFRGARRFKRREDLPFSATSERAHDAAPPPRKKSRSHRLTACKRAVFTPIGSLPTFCGLRENNSSSLKCTTSFFETRTPRRGAGGSEPKRRLRRMKRGERVRKQGVSRCAPSAAKVFPFSSLHLSLFFLLCYIE